MTLNDLAQIGSHNKSEKQAYKSNPDIKLQMSQYDVELVPLAKNMLKIFIILQKIIEKNTRIDKRTSIAGKLHVDEKHHIFIVLLYQL